MGRLRRRDHRGSSGRVLLVGVGSATTQTGWYTSPRLRHKIRFHSRYNDPMSFQAIGLEIRSGACPQGTRLGARPQVREALGQGLIGGAALSVLVNDRQLGVGGRDVGEDWGGYAQGLEFAALESSTGFLDFVAGTGDL